MPKQRLKSETIARRIFDNYFDDIGDICQINAFHDCCGFNEVGCFVEEPSVQTMLKTTYEIFENCHLDSYEQFTKEYNEDRVVQIFESIYTSELEEKLFKGKTYPFIVTLLEKDQEMTVKAMEVIADKHPEITRYHNVVSGSTGNLLAIYVYAPTKV